MQLRVAPLRDQITAPARTILLMLLGAAGIVFIIACSNVANLILARSVRREGELAVRAALGASRGALRRTLLAESLVLCGAGAVLGVALARPLVAARRGVRRALLGARARGDRRRQPAVGRRGTRDGRGRSARLHSAPAVDARADRARARERKSAHHAGHESPPACVRGGADRVFVRAARGRGHAARRARSRCSPRRPATTCVRCSPSICRRRSLGARDAKEIQFYRGDGAPRRRGARRAGRRARQLRAVARRRPDGPRLPVRRRGSGAARAARRIPTAACASLRPTSSRWSACR